MSLALSRKTALKDIYIALIRSILDYVGAAIECASKYARDRLDVIQSKALMICCGAQRGTPRAALQIEMGELPLHLRRRLLLAQYAVKITNCSDHPTTAVFQDTWQLRNRYPADREPLAYKANEILQYADLPDYKQTIIAKPPWTVEPAKVNLQLAETSKTASSTIIGAA